MTFPVSATEKRRGAERKSALDVQICLVELGKERSAMLLDVSQLGIGVQSVEGPGDSPTTPFRFLLPDTNTIITGEGEIAWADRAGRMGIRYTQIAPQLQAEIARWMNTDSNPLFTDSPVTDEMADLDARDRVAQLEARILVSGWAQVQALNFLVDQIAAMTQASGVAIALEDGGGIICKASSGIAPQVGVRANPRSGLSWECARTGDVVHCVDTETDPRVDRILCRELKMRSAMLVPVKKDASVAGLVEVFSSRAQAFNNNTVILLRRVAEAVASLDETAPAAPDESTRTFARPQADPIVLEAVRPAEPQAKPADIAAAKPLVVAPPVEPQPKAAEPAHAAPLAANPPARVESSVVPAQVPRPMAPPMTAAQKPAAVSPPPVASKAPPAIVPSVSISEKAAVPVTEKAVEKPVPPPVVVPASVAPAPSFQAAVKDASRQNPEDAKPVERAGIQSAAPIASAASPVVSPPKAEAGPKHAPAPAREAPATAVAQRPPAILRTPAMSAPLPSVAFSGAAATAPKAMPIREVPKPVLPVFGDGDASDEAFERFMADSGLAGESTDRKRMVLIVIAAILFVAALAVGGWYYWSHLRAKAAVPPAQPVTTAPPPSAPPTATDSITVTPANAPATTAAATPSAHPKTQSPSEPPLPEVEVRQFTPDSVVEAATPVKVPLPTSAPAQAQTPVSPLSIQSSSTAGVAGILNHPVPSPLLRTGAPVSQGVSGGNQISRTQPVYPPAARSIHLTGTVNLRVHINTRGVVEAVDVLSGPSILSTAAVNAVRRWRYEPLRLNGKAIENEITVAVKFELPR